MVIEIFDWELVVRAGWLRMVGKGALLAGCAVRNYSATDAWKWSCNFASLHPLIHFHSYNSFRWPVMKACVTNLFKGRSSRHERERDMGRLKWFATSQRPRVIAAMVKGTAWLKVISTENLFDNRARWLWVWGCPSRSWYLPPWSPSFCRPHQGTR